MFKVGSLTRALVNAAAELNNPSPAARGQTISARARKIAGYKTRQGSVQDADGRVIPAHIRQRITAPSRDKMRNAISAHFEDGTVLSANGFGSGQGSSTGQLERFNPVFDDLSRGTVAEDWIPKDIKGQNRMWRIMMARGQIEGPVVETLAEVAWSDFDILGVADPKVLDVYYSAKEAVNVEDLMPDFTKEFLVMGRVTAQLVMHPRLGIFTDVLIHDSDYIKVTPIPRTNYMPKIDLLPSPEVQAWARSQDPRDLKSKEDLPASLLEQFQQNQPIALDPLVTAYIPRRSYFNDMIGTSFYVRNIPLWGLEKSLINATLTGHRRRAGPITHIQVGSENWEPTPEEIDNIVAAFVAAEEDSVSAVIGTLPDVQVNQMRGGSGEIWKWSDEWSFLQEAKLRAFGFNESLLSGDATLENRTEAMTIFMERVKAHRQFMTETFLINKFFRSIAHVHGFKKRSTAELKHRIRVKQDDANLILPKLSFHKRLEPMADLTKSELYEKMEEKGLPVTIRDWATGLGWGDPSTKLTEMKEDLKLRLKMGRIFAIRAEIEKTVGKPSDDFDGDEDSPAGDPQSALLKDIERIEKEIEALSFGDANARGEDELTKKALSDDEKAKLSREAEDESGNEDKGKGEGKIKSSSYHEDVIASVDTRVYDDPVEDLSRIHKTSVDRVIIDRDDIRIENGKLVGGSDIEVGGFVIKKSGDGGAY